MKILITGGNGYIAKSCIKFFESKYSIDVITRKNVDLSNIEDVVAFFKNKFYDVVLHTAITGGSRLVPDAKENTYNNLLMFENLLLCQKSYNKIISFGSGAELWAPKTPYGLSKTIINRIIEHIPNAYNIRIYGVFDENELSTRFIKTCINSCINNTGIDIHQDRLFDFFYMADLMKLLEYYINTSDPLKLIECCYPNKKTLYDIAKYVCEVFAKNPKDVITIKNFDAGVPYIGTSSLPPLDYVGLEKGIENVYNALNR
jgi:dTDP-4-dehydrorhamnose reductase